MRPWPIFFLATLTTACAQFPELDDPTRSDLSTLPYPELRPIDSLLTEPAPRATPQSQAELDARAERLRRRAKGLQKPVLDANTRDRLSPEPD